VSALRESLGRLARVLTFRFNSADILEFGRMDLALGLAFTWLAGMGRYWDDSRAGIAQQLGVGSIIYVFALSGVLWLIVRPLSQRECSYVRVLTLVTYTAPPALLYAVPVELFADLKTGNQLNLGFLLVVSLWRVSIFWIFVRRFTGLNAALATVVTLLPLGGIFLTLVNLNLHHVIFDIMGGIRQADRSVHDQSYKFLFLVTLLAVPVSVTCLLVWIIAVIGRLMDWMSERNGGNQGG